MEVNGELCVFEEFHNLLQLLLQLAISKYDAYHIYSLLPNYTDKQGLFECLEREGGGGILNKT